MTTEDYPELSMMNRTDIIAASIRLRAARKFAGIGQEALGDAIGRSVSNISNMERARSFPALEAIMYLWNNHRVDANFIVAGHYAQLPADVLPDLMRSLADEISKTDLLSGSEKPQLSAETQST